MLAVYLARFLYWSPISSNIMNRVDVWILEDIGGMNMTSSDLQEQLNLKALNLLKEDADKIEKLIEVQMENLATRYCPLYEEVLDTQMYGFSRQVDYAVRIGLVQETVGKQILSRLERNLATLYEAMNNKN
ncbi:hypothetical protein J42TS3_09210 [Paenibacillus vini]|uniref:UPF0358 protein J42TS3_09210 n=2 Tax=Paenibacillus TaxID=44249 RepID=A0ABQ4M7B4_9BACL|nr:hypothetical protein J42TS3_09210 [Paenibacillus vini]